MVQAERKKLAFFAEAQTNLSKNGHFLTEKEKISSSIIPISKIITTFAHHYLNQ